MAFPSAFLTDTVTIKRRASIGSASRDALNNPIYGGYTGGLATIYTGMPVKLAFSKRDVVFAATGERIEPSGVMYFNAGYTLQQEDRIITSDNIEYVCTGLNTAIVSAGVVDHYECILALP